MKTILPLACVALFASPVQAVLMQAEFRWTGNLGYTALITWQYDDAFPVISTTPNFTGLEPTLVGFVARSARYSIWRPDGTAIRLNQFDVFSATTWDSLQFDTVTKDLVPGSTFSFGENSFWIAGRTTTGFGFISEFDPIAYPVYQSWPTQVVDQSLNYSITVKRVPEAGETGAMLLGGLALLGVAAKRYRLV